MSSETPNPGMIPSQVEQAMRELRAKHFLLPEQKWAYADLGPVRDALTELFTERLQQSQEIARLTAELARAIDITHYIQGRWEVKYFTMKEARNVAEASLLSLRQALDAKEEEIRSLRASHRVPAAAPLGSTASNHDTESPLIGGQK